MKKDIMGFIPKCTNYQQIKSDHQKLDGLLHEVKFPTWMWEDINMDFIVGFPFTQKKYDSVCVVVDMLTKSTHFTPIRSSYSAEDYENTFID